VRVFVYLRWQTHSIRNRENEARWCSPSAYGCTNYPDCKETFPDAKGKPDFSPRKPKPAAKVSEQHKCQDCGKGLIRRPGKKKGAFFWGCSGFPECRTSYFDKAGKPVFETAKAG